MGIATCPIPTEGTELTYNTIGKPTFQALTAEQTPSNRVWEPGQHCLELDGVRGVAIVGVTLYRFSKELDAAASPVLALAKDFLSLGGRGVDLFFVLSGFLITGILLKTKSKRGFFRNFIARRALRIFPLYFATLLICLFIFPYLFSTKIFDLPSSNQFYLWTYTSNFLMARENTCRLFPFDEGNPESLGSNCSWGGRITSCRITMAGMDGCGGCFYCISMRRVVHGSHSCGDRRPARPRGSDGVGCQALPTPSCDRIVAVRCYRKTMDDTAAYDYPSHDGLCTGVDRHRKKSDLLESTT